MKLAAILEKYVDSQIMGVDIDDKNARIYIADKNDIITQTYAGKMPKNENFYRFDWHYKSTTDGVGESLTELMRHCKLNQITYIILKD